MKETHGLSAAEVRKVCDPELLGFASTAERLESPPQGGQQRAEEASSWAADEEEGRLEMILARRRLGSLSTPEM